MNRDWTKNLTLKQVAFLLIAVISFLLYGILTMVVHHLTDHLSDQQGAARWDEKGDSAHVSCFFEEHVEIYENDFMGFKKTLESMLKEVLTQDDSEENDKRLVVDAYSAIGTITVTSEKGKLEHVAAIGIGGDFFLFHPVQLLVGGYFTGNDLMQDSVLLDEDGAWQLFGSNDIIGQSVMIGGVPHYVAGVFQRPSGRLEEAAGMDKPIVFVSEDSLSKYGDTEGISNYEVIAPNPVEHFVYHALKEKLGVAEENMIVVENSSRYTDRELLSIVLDFGIRSMQKNAVHFPYWENIARGYEDICAVVFISRYFFLSVGVIIVTVYAWIRWKNRTWTLKSIGIRMMEKKEQLQRRTRKEKMKWEKF